MSPNTPADSPLKDIFLMLNSAKIIISDIKKPTAAIAIGQ
jgi:hypothetical protein